MRLRPPRRGKAIRFLEITMKLSILHLATVVFLCSPGLHAQTEIPQGVVSTGRITNVSNQAGVIALRVDQTGAQLVFEGMNNVPIYFADGRAASFADLEVDRHATIYYGSQGGRWVVAKVMLGAPPTPVAPAPAATHSEERALKSPAANDGDITTQPGTKARIDNDITTKPGSKDPLEHDITRKPAR
jgi:hypothetical protein